MNKKIIPWSVFVVLLISTSFVVHSYWDVLTGVATARAESGIMFGEVEIKIDTILVYPGGWPIDDKEPINIADLDGDEDNKEIVLLLGSQCTLVAVPTPGDVGWPNEKPVWKCDGTTIDPPHDTLIVVPTIAGAWTFTVECGNTKSVTITVVQPEVVSVDFRDGGVQDIFDVGLEPEWTKAGRNEPFTAKRNSIAPAHARFSAAKNLTFSTSVQVRGQLNHFATGTVWKNWPSSEVTLIGTMPSVIGIVGDPDNDDSEAIVFNWHYLADGGTTWWTCGTSKHTAYITWDTYQCAGKDFTKAHIAFACSKANGSTTLPQIGDVLGPVLMGSTYFGTNYPPPLGTGTDLFTTNTSDVWAIVDSGIKGD